MKDTKKPRPYTRQSYLEYLLDMTTEPNEWDKTRLLFDLFTRIECLLYAGPGAFKKRHLLMCSALEVLAAENKQWARLGEFNALAVETLSREQKAPQVKPGYAYLDSCWLDPEHCLPPMKGDEN
jgi:hypothetical protein